MQYPVESVVHQKQAHWKLQPLVLALEEKPYQEMPQRK